MRGRRRRQRRGRRRRRSRRRRRRRRSWSGSWRRRRRRRTTHIIPIHHLVTWVSAIPHCSLLSLYFWLGKTPLLTLSTQPQRAKQHLNCLAVLWFINANIDNIKLYFLSSSHSRQQAERRLQWGIVSASSTASVTSSFPATMLSLPFKLVPCHTNGSMSCQDT